MSASLGRGGGRRKPERPRDRLGRPLPPGSPDQLGAEDPEAFGLAPEESYSRALGLFRAGRFFEAHEWFEYVWNHPEVEAAERGFWKALAQAAAGYCHNQRGNAKGAAALLERAAAGLEAYLPGHRGLDLGVWIRTLREAARAVRGGEKEVPVP